MSSFSPTWQQVALLLGLVAAVVLTHVFAAPAIGAVTSIVSTIIGALFVDLRKPSTPSTPSDPKNGGAS